MGKRSGVKMRPLSVLTVVKRKVLLIVYNEEG